MIAAIDWLALEEASYYHGMRPAEFWSGYYDETIRWVNARSERLKYGRRLWEIALEIIRWVGYVTIAVNRKRNTSLKQPSYYLRLPHEDTTRHQTSPKDARRVLEEHREFSRRWAERQMAGRKAAKKLKQND